MKPNIPVVVAASSRKSSTSTMLNFHEDDDGFMGCLSSLSLDHGTGTGSVVLLSPTAMVVDRSESQTSRLVTPRQVNSAAKLDKVDSTMTFEPVPVYDGLDSAASNMAIGDMSSVLTQLLAEDSAYHQSLGPPHYQHH